MKILMWMTPAGFALKKMKILGNKFSAEFGYKVKYLNPKLATPDEPIDDDFDFACIWGICGESATGYHVSRAKGHPVLVLENAWYRRADYFQLGWNNANVLAHFCKLIRTEKRDDKRLKQVYAEYRDRRPASEKGKYLLLAGQVPGDMQLEQGFGRNEDYTQWIQNIATVIRQKYPHKRLMYRSHPHVDHIPLGVDGWERQDRLAITSFDACREAEVVITYNSHIGIEALISAVPCLSTGDSLYSHACMSDIAELESPRNKRNRSQMLCNLSYRQWTIDDPELTVHLDDLIQKEMPR